MATGAPYRTGRLQHINLDELHKHRVWYLLLGILLVIAGTIAIGHAYLATAVSMIFIGVELVLAGILLIVLAHKVQRWGGFFLELLMGVLYAVTGGLVLANPGAGALALTLMIAMFLMIGGLFRIVISLYERFPHWGWVLLLGVINLLLGFMIWRQWPYSGLWVIGLFVGIEMIFNGWTLVMLSMAAKRVGADETAPDAKPATA